MQNLKSLISLLFLSLCWVGQAFGLNSEEKRMFLSTLENGEGRVELKIPYLGLGSENYVKELGIGDAVHSTDSQEFCRTEDELIQKDLTGSAALRRYKSKVIAIPLKNNGVALPRLYHQAQENIYYFESPQHKSSLIKVLQDQDHEYSWTNNEMLMKDAFDQMDHVTLRSRHFDPEGQYVISTTPLFKNGIGIEKDHIKFYHSLVVDGVLFSKKVAFSDSLLLVEREFTDEGLKIGLRTNGFNCKYFILPNDAIKAILQMWKDGRIARSFVTTYKKD